MHGCVMYKSLDRSIFPGNLSHRNKSPSKNDMYESIYESLACNAPPQQKKKGKSQPIKQTKKTNT